VTRPASTGVRVTARRLPVKDAAAFVERSISAAPSRFEAIVSVQASAEELSSRIPSYWGEIRALSAKTCEFRARDDDLGWLAMRVAMLGADFEVREPPELIAELRAMAERLRRAAM